MSDNKNTWGGARKGAGRPVGTKKPEGVRSQHALRAYDNEWLLIKEFADIVKKDRERAERIIKTK